MENHGKNRALNICYHVIHYHAYLLQDIEFAGYLANDFDTRKLAFVRQNSTIRIRLDIHMKC